MAELLQVVGSVSSSTTASGSTRCPGPMDNGLHRSSNTPFNPPPMRSDATTPPPLAVLPMQTHMPHSGSQRERKDWIATPMSRAPQSEDGNSPLLPPASPKNASAAGGGSELAPSSASPVAQARPTMSGCAQRASDGAPSNGGSIGSGPLTSSGNFHQPSEVLATSGAGAYPHPEGRRFSLGGDTNQGDEEDGASCSLSPPTSALVGGDSTPLMVAPEIGVAVKGGSSDELLPRPLRTTRQRDTESVAGHDYSHGSPPNTKTRLAREVSGSHGNDGEEDGSVAARKAKRKMKKAKPKREAKKDKDRRDGENTEAAEQRRQVKKARLQKKLDAMTPSAQKRFKEERKAKKKAKKEALAASRAARPSSEKQRQPLQDQEVSPEVDMAASPLPRSAVQLASTTGGEVRPALVSAINAVRRCTSASAGGPCAPMPTTPLRDTLSSPAPIRRRFTAGEMGLGNLVTGANTNSFLNLSSDPHPGAGAEPAEEGSLTDTPVSARGPRTSGLYGNDPAGGQEEEEMVQLPSLHELRAAGELPFAPHPPSAAAGSAVAAVVGLKKSPSQHAPNTPMPFARRSVDTASSGPSSDRGDQRKATLPINKAILVAAAAGKKRESAAVSSSRSRTGTKEDARRRPSSASTLGTGSGSYYGSYSSYSSYSTSSSEMEAEVLALKEGCKTPPPAEAFLDLNYRYASTASLQQHAEPALIHEWNLSEGCWGCVETTVVLNPQPFAQGNMRASYHMIDMGRPNCMLVAKRYLKRTVGEDQYYDDVSMHSISGHWARMYNALNPPKKVRFVPAAVLVLPKRSPPLILAMEPQLTGKFVKYNNNSGYVRRNARWTPQAFSHFTYIASRRELMIVDIQGVDDIYTDPQILSPDGEGYGRGNLGLKGVRRFLESHKCNAVCRALNLPPLVKNDKGVVIAPLPEAGAARRKAGSGQSLREERLPPKSSASSAPSTSGHLFDSTPGVSTGRRTPSSPHRCNEAIPFPPAPPSARPVMPLHPHSGRRPPGSPASPSPINSVQMSPPASFPGLNASAFPPGPSAAMKYAPYPRHGTTRVQQSYFATGVGGMISLPQPLNSVPVSPPANQPFGRPGEARMHSSLSNSFASPAPCTQPLLQPPAQSGGPLRRTPGHPDYLLPPSSLSGRGEGTGFHLNGGRPYPSPSTGSFSPATPALQLRPEERPAGLARRQSFARQPVFTSVEVQAGRYRQK